MSSILKCYVCTKLFKDFKFITGLWPPSFFGTRNTVDSRGADLALWRQ